MQMTTSGSIVKMPVCLQQPHPDGSFELSTVHRPASESSFYADIHNHNEFSFLADNHNPGQARRLVTWLKDKILSTASWEPSELTTSTVVEPVAMQRAAEIVSTAKRVTGLSIKDLAYVFCVSRQTLYNYRKSQEAISDRNWVRLKAVDQEISKLSEILPYSPGALAKHFKFEGHTLVELLSASQIDTQSIQRMAHELAGQLSDSRRHAKAYNQTSIEQLTRHV